MNTEFFQSSDINYPAFFRFKNTELIVLAFNLNSGVVVKNPKNEFDQPINYFSFNFSNFDDPTIWTQIRAKVTFSTL